MKKIIIGNWKLNLDHLQGIQLLQKINYSLPKDVEENSVLVTWQISLKKNFNSLITQGKTKTSFLKDFTVKVDARIPKK